MSQNTEKIRYAAIVTLGCRLNQADTAIISEKLRNAGYMVVKPDDGHPLSIAIINTCAVTSSASQKSRQSARSIRAGHPGAYIIVTGCSTETENSWNDEPSVDLIIPNKDKTRIMDYIGRKPPAVSSGLDSSFTEQDVGYYPFKQRANIKIQDGCDAFCTYCIVPYGRGLPRSREWDNTISEFRELVRRGYKEIVLTGVNIARYQDGSRNLSDLLQELSAVEGDFRIRLGSTEPGFAMSRLLSTMAQSDKICRFLHMPVQYGNDEILRGMGRKYFTGEFRDFVIEATTSIPGICIGSDIIAGFPGETEKHFSDCMEFITSLPIAYLHVFKYSKRPGTPATSFKNQVHSKTTYERHKALTEAADTLSRKFMSAQIGRIERVLYEEIKNNYLTGLTDNFIKVHVPPRSLIGGPDSYINRFIPTKLTGLLKNRCMTGEPGC